VRLAFAPTGPDRPAGPAHTPEPADRLPFTDPRASAVLCALWDDGGEAVVLLTRRSASLRFHTGEVSFPGGRIDPGETARQAALREASEEVGLDPAAVEIVGQLPALATLSSRSAITPFVAVVAGTPALAPNPTEVERAFSVPLATLMAEGVFHEERWDAPGAGPRPVYFFDLPGDLVWGATARMLWDLLGVLRPVVETSAHL
jgi:8-oxo-dGTP pyrophosphatase MutT (NUDIX family)